MKVKEALSRSILELKKAKVEGPISSAHVLMADVLGVRKEEVLVNSERVLSGLELKKLKNYIDQRKNHKSVWHIVGRVSFWGLDFFVSSDVLVPRPETEILVQEALGAISNFEFRISNSNQKSETKNQKSKISILDVGTGSGTIAIALASESPEIKLTAVDKSPKAIKVAQKNAKYNKIKNIKFIESDLFSSVKGRFDIICANLPYIPSEEIGLLPVEVCCYEPHLALDGGSKGLEIYEKFLSGVGKYLKPEGFVFCEIGINQGKKIKKMIKKYLPGFRCIIKRDLAEIDRVAIILKS
ncbi:MAG: peptide chain release factor N(5)-glutamine methyltransferase [Patescibacteria group bacterium]|nr:peptide chain release factor N(5)-glutamine methyltransferase [Patescibacteria group bacterium]